MRYPHYVRIYERGKGSVDEETGDWTPGEDKLFYQGEADVQDSGTELRRAREGGLIQNANAVVFINGNVSGIPPEAACDILWNPESVPSLPPDWEALPDEADTDDGEVEKVTRLGDTVFVRYI